MVMSTSSLWVAFRLPYYSQAHLLVSLSVYESPLKYSLTGSPLDTIGYFPQMSMVGLSLVLILLLTASRLLDAPPRRRTSSSSRLSSFAISTPKITQKSTAYPDDGDSATIVEGKEPYRCSPEKDPVWHRDSSEHEQRSREVPLSGPWRSRPDNGTYLARKQY